MEHLNSAARNPGTPAEPTAPALPENGCCKQIPAPSRELNHSSALTRLHLVRRKGQTGLALTPTRSVTVTNPPGQLPPTLTSLKGGFCRAPRCPQSCPGPELVPTSPFLRQICTLVLRRANPVSAGRSSSQCSHMCARARWWLHARQS